MLEPLGGHNSDAPCRGASSHCLSLAQQGSPQTEVKGQRLTPSVLPRGVCTQGQGFGWHKRKVPDARTGCSSFQLCSCSVLHKEAVGGHTEVINTGQGD